MGKYVTENRRRELHHHLYFQHYCSYNSINPMQSRHKSKILQISFTKLNNIKSFTAFIWDYIITIPRNIKALNIIYYIHNKRSTLKHKQTNLYKPNRILIHTNITKKQKTTQHYQKKFYKYIHTKACISLPEERVFDSWTWAWWVLVELIHSFETQKLDIYGSWKLNLQENHETHMRKDEEELKYWSGAAFLLLWCCIIYCQQNECNKRSMSQES